MDSELRAELNRLWTNQQAAEMVLIALVTDRHTRAELAEMHERMIEQAELLFAEDRAMSVNMTRALDRLFRLIDHAQKAGR